MVLGSELIDAVKESGEVRVSVKHLMDKRFEKIRWVWIGFDDITVKNC